MIKFKHRGNFQRIEKFLYGSKELKIKEILKPLGERGVQALSSATPRDTGLSASSWNYEINITQKGYAISWINSNLTENGIPVVILLQYGHGTGNGGYVQGQDFINPAIRPIFDEISKTIFEEVSNL